MQIIITLLALLLVGVAYLAVKFILNEDKEKKNKEKKDAEAIAVVENTLKQAQEELAKEKAEKQETEDLLYKVKDELDSLKNLNNELNQKIKDSGKFKEALDKKDEDIKRESSEKERLKAELDKTKPDLNKARADLESARKELEQAKKEKDSVQQNTGFSSEVVVLLQKENLDLKGKLKVLEEIHEGLKGQYDELSKQLEEINQIRIEEALAQEKAKTGPIQTTSPQVVKPAEEKTAQPETKDLPKAEEPKLGKSEPGKKPEDIKPKTTSDYLKEKAKEAAGFKKDQIKPEEKSQKGKEDKKAAAADGQSEKQKSPGQQKPPSGSPENKPQV
jgi:septal ring factor EnvC (AmiA/AmiB activator)